MLVGLTSNTYYNGRCCPFTATSCADQITWYLSHHTYSCGQHGPVTAWFRSTRPGDFLPVPKISASLRVGIHCLSQRNCFCYGYILCFIRIFFCLKNKLLQRNCRVMQVPRRCFWKAEKTTAAACSVSPLTSLPLRTRAKRGQAIWRKRYTLKRSILLSTGAQELLLIYLISNRNTMHSIS